MPTTAIHKRFSRKNNTSIEKSQNNLSKNLHNSSIDRSIHKYTKEVHNRSNLMETTSPIVERAAKGFISTTSDLSPSPSYVKMGSMLNNPNQMQSISTADLFKTNCTSLRSSIHNRSHGGSFRFPKRK